LDKGDGENVQKLPERCVSSRLTGILLRVSCSRKQDISSTDQGDHGAQFYEVYRKVAEEYDKEFLKKYDEDLNTTLIFVSHVVMSLWWASAYYDARLVFFQPSPLHSSFRLILNFSPTRATRQLLSSAFLFTKLTIPPSETTFPPSHNGPGLHAQ
jgi:hypothetical protein